MTDRIFAWRPWKRAVFSRIVLLLVFIVGIVCSTYGYSQESYRSAGIQYITEPAVRGSIEQQIVCTGEVTAAELVTVGAQVSGQIKKIYVVLGQAVRRGDMLAEIDSTPQRNALEIQKAMLDKYTAQLTASEVSLIEAKQNYTRQIQLLNQDATSTEQYQKAQNAVARAHAKIAELRAVIRQTQISVKKAEDDVAYTRITAPISGTVVSMPVKAGQTVNAAQQTPTIVQLADLAQMEIKLKISEADIARVRPGAPVTVSTISDAEPFTIAYVRSIDPAPTDVSETQPQKKASNGNAVYYYARLFVENIDGKLKLGMTTKHSICIATVNGVIKVPLDAVAYERGKSFLRILENGIPVKKEIQTGVANEMVVEVLSNVSEGDAIVVSQSIPDESLPTPFSF
ncbi:efflux RND transporter periplasmic adaptor subunit [Halodesulfovibrio spirochaetisodalis]|uniref:efflux RND transporter periplasmic adaptor subunit n=1 Tax=Halodesulfovibrio spirochaetisodalis TaxID=1560234 RepID=UPI0018D4D878|nr:efflux RND transporter periplasmic adaptor subunit [Halodesulfovibrio spirochaetisodalis]